MSKYQTPPQLHTWQQLTTGGSSLVPLPRSCENQRQVCWSQTGAKTGPSVPGVESTDSNPSLHCCSLHVRADWFGHFHWLCWEILFSPSGPSRFEDEPGVIPVHTCRYYSEVCVWARGLPFSVLLGGHWNGSAASNRGSLLPCRYSHTAMLFLSRAFNFKFLKQHKKSRRAIPTFCFSLS